MKIYNDIEQGTDAWFDLRKLKMTGSKGTAIASAGKGLDTLVLELASEYYSTGPRKSFSNEHTDRGNELEPVARSMYELETGNTVEEVGFVERDEYTGVSPDGLVGDDGMVEIKCLMDKEHLRMILDRKIASGHLWQIQMQLLICERKWCDYVVYNPNFKESLLVFRVEADPKKFEKLEKGLVKGKEMILAVKEKMGS